MTVMIVLSYELNQIKVDYFFSFYNPLSNQYFPINHNISFCKFCSNTPTFATKRDVIITFLHFRSENLNRTFGFINLIQSFRTVNQRADFFLISFDIINSTFSVFLKNFGIRFFLAHHNNSATLQEEKPELIRYVGYHQWCQKYYYDYDRVFHVDAFDTFFQGDIFTTDFFVDNTLNVILEGSLIENCYFNYGWIDFCYGPNISKSLSSNTIICSGTFGASMKIFKKTIELLLNQPKFWDSDCYQPGNDQGHFNYLIWSGAISKNNIPISYHSCFDGIATAQYCCPATLPSFCNPNKYGEISTFNSTNVGFLLIHQYDRRNHLKSYVNTVCSH